MEMVFYFTKINKSQNQTENGIHSQLSYQLKNFFLVKFVVIIAGLPHYKNNLSVAMKDYTLVFFAQTQPVKIWQKLACNKSKN
jgi:hypothetical protein